MLKRSRGLLPVLVLVAGAGAVWACGDGEEGTGKLSGGTGGSAGADAATDAGDDPGVWGTRTPVTETRQVEGLTASVNAVRDQHGMVHIYARTPEDAFRVQGYMMAVDRAGQLELARRLASGRLAEIFGVADAGQVDDDITMRTIGLHRAAQAMYDAMDPNSEEKRVLDAFADGVTQFFRGLREGKVQLAQPLGGMDKKFFTDWTAVDTLAMGRLQSFSLSYDADSEAGLSGRIDAVRAAFNPSATDPLALKRKDILVDLVRFKPPVTNTPLPSYPDEATPTSAYWHGAPSARKPGLGLAPSAMSAAMSPVLRAQVQPFLNAVQRAKDFLGGDEYAGSNNWAVAGSKTASGNAIVANDPHLGLTSPMVFWPTHVVVESSTPAESLEIIGVAFPGIPGVILGSNRNVAWGATTAGYDVSDVWREKVASDASGVVFKGSTVAFQKISETIKISGSADYTFDVLVVPHHGPLMPNIVDHKVAPPAGDAEALSVRWTGHAPTGEIAAILGLNRAKTVDEARASLTTFGVGAQNWMLADSAGDIAWTAPAALPYRDKKAFTWDPATFSGSLPCMVLDGTSGDHEWTGVMLEEQYLPKLKTPTKGWIATANTDNVASTVDNDPSNDTLPNAKPFYIGCDFAQGFRLGRIEERLAAEADGMTPAGMANIQGDHKSSLGTRLAKHLVAALEAAEEQRLTPGKHPKLAAVVADARYAGANVPEIIGELKAWDTAGFAAAAGLSLSDGSLDVPAAQAADAKATLVFNAWLVRAVARALEDEMTAAGQGSIGTNFMLRAFIAMLEEDPTKLATYDAATGESALWDDMSTTAVTESKDDRIVTALLDAVDDLNALQGTDRGKWRWGDLHRVRFNPLVPVWIVAIPAFSDPVFGAGFPRHGDQWVVDASNFGVVRKLSDKLNFSYGSGPVQRFVAEMTKAGPKIQNALPGGAVLSTESPYFADEAEYWRKNETHAIAFEKDDVEASAKAAPLKQHFLFPR
ncbi:MAG: penicillin acylase family protein [Polyangiaceae bacterium]